MDIFVIILIIFIIIFFIGNVLLSYLFIKKQKSFNFSSYDAKIDILNSKIDVLNKRISLLEENKKDSLNQEKIVIKEKEQKTVLKPKKNL